MAIAQRRSLFEKNIGVFCILVFVGAHSAFGATTNLVFGPEPEWILPPSEEIAPTTTETNRGESFVLIERQINAQTGEDFHRTIRRIRTAAGVQNGARFSVDFDPSYAQLSLHHIRIRRGGEVFNRLTPEGIQLLHREKELEKHIYNGELSAVAIIDDVRIGDAIESAYTIKGRNPVWAGKFCETVLLGWPFPIQHYRVRLLWPAQETLRLHFARSLNKPLITESNGTAEYLWDLRDTPAVVPEAHIPSWYNPYPRVEFTDYNGWQEVADWATRLFQSPATLSFELQKQIDQWQAASTNSENRLLHALEFVQDEVRYLGMEGGIQSHKPADPSVVFARRYGDCKDKALLLCTILNRLGIEASPALVNARGKVDPTMASPHAFNHAIVRAKLGDKTIWADPTLSYQKGPLHSRYLPDYGDALVLAPTTQELVAVPRSTNGAPRTIVRESLALNASDRFSSLRVATSMEGRDAEAFRASIAAGLGEVLSQSRLTSYARYYSHIRTNAPCRIEETTNHVMQVTDDYSVPEIWSSGEAWRLSFDYFAQELGNVLGLAVNPQRTMPVGIEYPCRRIHTTILHLPASSSMHDTIKVIRGPAEELRFKRTSSGKTMTLEYDYRSTADSVAVADLNEHLKARREMLDCLGFSLWWRPEVLRTSTMPRTPRGPIGWTVLVFCCGMIVLWNVFNRRRSREAQAFSP